MNQLKLAVMVSTIGFIPTWNLVAEAKLSDPCGAPKLTANAQDAQNSLSWTPVISASAYELHRTRLPESTATTIYQGSQISYLDAGLFTGQPYSYVVFSICGTNKSGPSNSVTSIPHPGWKASRQSAISKLESVLSSSLTLLENDWDTYYKATNRQKNKLYTVRDLMNGALAELYLRGGYQGKAREYVDQWIATVAGLQIIPGRTPVCRPAEVGATQCTDGQAAPCGYIPFTANINPSPLLATPSDCALNGTEFSLAATYEIAHGWFDQLSVDTQNNLKSMMKSGLIDIRNRANGNGYPQLAKYYTNAILMNSSETVLIGQYLADQSAIEEGNALVETVLKNVGEHGIHEFSSPSYYELDLSMLEMLYLYSENPKAKAWANWGANAFWSDISSRVFNLGANNNPHEQWLTGPASRNYDYITTDGGIQVSINIELAAGTISSLPRMEKLEDIFVWINGKSTLQNTGPVGYQPGADSLKYNQIDTLPRTVKELVDGRNKNGGSIYSDSYTYLTSDYSMGTASADYGQQLMGLDLLLSSTKDNFSSTSIRPGSYFCTSKDPRKPVPIDQNFNPYGVVGSGKAKELSPMNPAFVQSEGSGLYLLTLLPGQYGHTNQLATSIPFPAIADAIYVLSSTDSAPTQVSPSKLVGNNFNGTHEIVCPDGGKNKIDFDLCTDQSKLGLPFGQDWVMGFREGTGCAAIRIFHADGLDDFMPYFSLVQDYANGTRTSISSTVKNAARIEVCSYHKDQSPKPAKLVPVKVGIFVQAGHCDNDKDLKTMMTFVKNYQIKPADAGEDWDTVKDKWSAAVSVPNSFHDPNGSTHLSVSQYLRSGIIENQNVVAGQLRSRAVNGTEVQFNSSINVNGFDVGAYLLENYPGY